MHLKNKAGIVPSEAHNPVAIEISYRLRLTKSLEVLSRGIRVILYRKEPSLDEVLLFGSTKANGNISFPHANVEFLIRQDELNLNLWEEIQYFPPLCERAT